MSSTCRSNIRLSPVFVNPRLVDSTGGVDVIIRSDETTSSAIQQQQQQQRSKEVSPIIVSTLSTPKSPSNVRRKNISAETGSRNHVRRRKNAAGGNEGYRKNPTGKTTSNKKSSNTKDNTNGITTDSVTEDPLPVNESLRWDFVLDDPDLEAVRLERYRENRRQRYAEAAAARRRDSNIGTNVDGLPSIGFGVTNGDSRWLHVTVANWHAWQSHIDLLILRFHRISSS